MSCPFPLTKIDIYILFLNIIDQLKIIMRNQLFDVLAISENKLDDNIDSTEMGIKGYKVLRRDRNRYGGGVLFFIKEITCVKQHENLEVLQCDI